MKSCAELEYFSFKSLLRESRRCYKPVSSMAITVPRPSYVGFCWINSNDLVSSLGKRPAVGKVSFILQRVALELVFSAGFINLEKGEE